MYGPWHSPGCQFGSVAVRFQEPIHPSWRWPAVARSGSLTIARNRVQEGLAFQGPGGEVRSSALAALEAILWLSREPIVSRKLAGLAGLADGTEARTLVRSLNRMYDAEGCAFRVVEVAGGFQLMTRAKFVPWLRRLQASQTEIRLSAPALETLAVVAYRQPVLRADVEAVRGVQCGEILRQLMERNLVRISGRSEDLGRPFLYGTTRQFLQVFGLRHLEDLPRPELLRLPPQSEERGPAGQEIADTKDLSQPVCFQETEGESNVKTLTSVKSAFEDVRTRKAAGVQAQEPLEHDDNLRAAEEDEDFEDEDLEDEDLDEEEDEDDLDEDEDFEDDDWEEVDDEEEDVDDELDEDEDLEEDDEDWEEDEDWDEDEDDWDEDEEEEDDEDWE